MQFDLAAGHATEPWEKPDRSSYEEWLARVWTGDRRELRRGRYLQQQRDLQKAFEESKFFLQLSNRLRDWSLDYEDRKGVPLFGAPPEIKLELKPWESFLSKTWRANVHNNPNWPAPPADGWLSPDCWFEGLWDVVRCRIVVRYLDGVQELADHMTSLGGEVGADVEVWTHAQDYGYYAMHVTVRQDFRVQTLNFEDEEERFSKIEIQLTTELQETIGSLTHGYFEKRREEKQDPDQKWQWNYQSPEFTPYYLGHMLHYLEGMIMRVREDIGRAPDA
ncbi:hypothetical protein SAMN05660748_1379 [Blastococcus aggregatus]|uniref:Uncharacterized protein n=1 Tax=Blastococcus aggregatus TaxID=38502 RepID=A0A285V3G3_9ACTN|nr:hypothetical protein [Blastococcus aggregatus]SOC48674.1 hypothetical protein SAMN05660748_1379 [Blastococcus aggregatus]